MGQTWYSSASRSSPGRCATSRRAIGSSCIWASRMIRAVVLLRRAFRTEPSWLDAPSMTMPIASNALRAAASIPSRMFSRTSKARRSILRASDRALPTSPISSTLPPRTPADCGPVLLPIHSVPQQCAEFRFRGPQVLVREIAQAPARPRRVSSASHSLRIGRTSPCVAHDRSSRPQGRQHAAGARHRALLQETAAPPRVQSRRSGRTGCPPGPVPAWRQRSSARRPAALAVAATAEYTSSHCMASTSNSRASRTIARTNSLHGSPTTMMHGSSPELPPVITDSSACHFTERRRARIPAPAVTLHATKAVRKVKPKRGINSVASGQILGHGRVS